MKAIDNRPVEKIEKEIESAIQKIYPQCDKSAFSLYERALRYIADNR